MSCWLSGCRSHVPIPFDMALCWCRRRSRSRTVTAAIAAASPSDPSSDKHNRLDYVFVYWCIREVVWGVYSCTGSSFLGRWKSDSSNYISFALCDLLQRLTKHMLSIKICPMPPMLTTAQHNNQTINTQKKRRLLFGDENYELSLIWRRSGNLVRSKESRNISKW